MSDLKQYKLILSSSYARFRSGIKGFAGLSVVVSVTVSVTILMMALPCQAEETEVRFATAYAADNFQTLNLLQFAKDVMASTGGRVKMSIFAAGTLLKPAEIFAGVISDKAEAGEVIMSSLAKDIPVFGVDSLPFTVRGYEDAYNLWMASKPEVEKALNKRGLKLLYTVPWPPQNLYSKKPLSSLADFKGMRMRSYNPASERIAELALATAVPVQVIDLEKAIASDKLDLMITSSWTGVETRAWSKMQYYYRANAWIPKNMVFISQKVFARFDADTQKKIMDAAQHAEKRGWDMSRDSDAGFENQLRNNKVKVDRVDALLRNNLDRLGEQFVREWLKTASSEEVSILLKYTTERSMK
ncbi:TRAP transporter substrate-binding protein [Undibacterium sp. CY18W]|uniref:TRAP transporter substrate-binding protein n=1 Tax=Undibacterium hunanense TaxID=2762292 RepID=A0ABR6ZTY4_9BURK|nr:TRAP transporter substrate-binding protein [Undibacterium hunanense]MBC3919269.1 TRAP transporter substrate-binding protein [Undibacterium hunanense]